MRCEKCRGWGKVTGFDMVPYGSTHVRMEYTDSCGECIDKGKCPHCGKEIEGGAFAEDGIMRCKDKEGCGWNEEDSEGDDYGEEEARYDYLADQHDRDEDL
jgi:hypothetical protein